MITNESVNEITYQEYIKELKNGIEISCNLNIEFWS